MSTTPVPRLLELRFQEIAVLDDGVHLTPQESGVTVIRADQAVGALRALADAYERAEAARVAPPEPSTDDTPKEP